MANSRFPQGRRMRADGLASFLFLPNLQNRVVAASRRGCHQICEGQVAGGVGVWITAVNQG